MNSIAIWYEGKANSDNSVPEIAIHVNHWKLRFDKNILTRKLQNITTKTLGRWFKRCVFHPSDYFMDYGLMIENGGGIESICIYIPSEISDKKKLIEDIGTKLQDKRLLTAVFNEPYNIVTTTNEKHFTVRGNGVDKFNIYMLDIESDIKTEKKYHGTIIKFPFKYFKGLPTYYRLRLKSVFVSGLSYIYQPSNSFLESAFSSIEIIDFRINDNRNLDISLVEEVNKQKRFKISLVHYFVMRSVKDEYIISNNKLNAVRQLEDETWKTYIPKNGYDYEKSFAYHLKKKLGAETKSIDEFAAVLKFRFEDNKLIRYFIYLLIFAFFTELLGNFLYDLCKPYLMNWFNFR